MSEESAPRSTRRPHQARGRPARAAATPVLSSGRPRAQDRARPLGNAGPPAGPPRRHNLPPQPRSLIGRERELGVARQRLLRADVRLLTLTGPPGVGKTRWRSSWRPMCEEFEAGAWFVDLAPIGDARLVATAIARALGLQDVPAAPPRCWTDFLRDRAAAAAARQLRAGARRCRGRRPAAGGLSEAEGRGDQSRPAAPALGTGARGPAVGAARAGAARPRWPTDPEALGAAPGGPAVPRAGPGGRARGRPRRRGGRGGGRDLHPPGRLAAGDRATPRAGQAVPPRRCCGGWSGPTMGHAARATGG